MPFLAGLAGTDFVAISIIVILSEGIDPLADRVPQSKDPAPIRSATILARRSHQAFLCVLCVFSAISAVKSFASTTPSHLCHVSFTKIP
jgi:predicted transcriptional regulator YheO